MDIKNVVKGYNYSNVSADFYGVKPHENAIKIADYEFFWDTFDELAPFGSEEGYISFMELKEWLEENPGKPIIECFSWIFSLWDLTVADYNDSILENENIIKTIQDYDFDESILSLDVTIIATGFGQLIIQGKIDESIKNIVHLAILRQMNSIVLDEFLLDKRFWKYERYKYLQTLLEILEKS